MIILLLLTFCILGYITAALVVLESLGVLFSPITFSMRGLFYIYGIGKAELWKAAVQISKYNTSTSVFNYNPTIDKYNLIQPDLSDFSGIVPYIGSLARDSFVQLSSFIADSERIGSRAYNFFSFFDFDRNLFLMSISYEFNRIFAIPIWMSAVIWRAPEMLYDYYVLGKGRFLPPQRPACLIRAVSACKNSSN